MITAKTSSVKLRIVCTVVLLTALLIAYATGAESAAAFDDRFPNEPAARRLFDRMEDVVRKARTLSYSSKFERVVAGGKKTACTYRLWLKKPNYFRMETRSLDGKSGGVMIGDGKNLWVYWPQGRPQWSAVQESTEDAKTRFNSYMKKPAPQGKISILHEAVFLGGGISFPILDASIFHGHVDSINQSIDAVRHLGTESVSGEVCDRIEVRLLDGQRRWWLWISRRDHLPRRLKEVVQVKTKIAAREEYSVVVVDEPIADSKFRWQPPDGWKQWRLPDDRSGYPKVGSKAPDFNLASVDGGRVRLSDFRGKTVWLTFWRLGCPPCRKETPFLQRLYLKNVERNFVVIAVNVSDDRDSTLKYLRKLSVTFPNVLDTSEKAQRVFGEDYGVGGLPMNMLIGADGVVMAAGFEHDSDEAIAALKKAGVEVAVTAN